MAYFQSITINYDQSWDGSQLVALFLVQNLPQRGRRI